MVAPLRDMAADADEAYYAEQYRHWLAPVMAELRDHSALVLDVGCGHGRLALAVAESLPDSRVVGVDVSPGALAGARAHAAERGLENLELHEQDAVPFVAAFESASVDLALFTEVSFFMPAYGDALAEIARVLRPGGTLFASFRSLYFNLLWSIRDRDFDGARTVRDFRRGVLWDTPYEFCWHTPSDVGAELAALDLDVGAFYGIGPLSGIEGDPLAAIARPSELDADDRRRLFELETSIAAEFVGCARYILAVARRR